MIPRHNALQFVNSCGGQNLFEISKICDETMESPVSSTTSKSLYSFNEAVHSEMYSHVQKIEEDTSSYVTPGNSYKLLKFSESQNTQCPHEVINISFKTKESFASKPITQHSCVFFEANQKRDKDGQINELVLKKEVVKDDKIDTALESSLPCNRFKDDVFEMFEVLNYRGKKSFFEVWKTNPETKETWASQVICHFDDIFNEVNRKCDSDNQMNQLKLYSKNYIQEQFHTDSILNSNDKSAKNETTFPCQTEHTETKISKRRPEDEISVHEGKYIVENINQPRSSTADLSKILPSYNPAVSINRKLFNIFTKYCTTRGNIPPLVSTVRINTSLMIHELERRGVLIKNSEFSQSRNPCLNEKTHARVAIKLKILADEIQEFYDRKHKRNLLDGRVNGKRNVKETKFQENNSRETTPMDLLIVDLKNCIKKSEFFEKEEQLSKDINEFLKKLKKQMTFMKNTIRLWKLQQN